MTEPSNPRALAAQLLAASAHALPLAEALEHIRRRRARLLSSPAPSGDFAAPEPVPFFDDPDTFASGFWQTRPAKPKDQRPAREASTEAPAPPGRPSKTPSPFSVIDGDRED